MKEKPVNVCGNPCGYKTYHPLTSWSVGETLHWKTWRYCGQWKGPHVPILLNSAYWVSKCLCALKLFWTSLTFYCEWWKTNTCGSLLWNNFREQLLCLVCIYTNCCSLWLFERKTHICIIFVSIYKANIHLIFLVSVTGKKVIYPPFCVEGIHMLEENTIGMWR